MNVATAGIVKDGVIVPDHPLPEGKRVVIQLVEEMPAELAEEIAGWNRASDQALVKAEGRASPGGPTMLEVLDRIHQDQVRRGQRPMTEEEMAAEIARMRAEDDEYEERCRAIWSQTTKSDSRDAP